MAVILPAALLVCAGAWFYHARTRPLLFMNEPRPVGFPGAPGAAYANSIMTDNVGNIFFADDRRNVALFIAARGGDPSVWFSDRGADRATVGASFANQRFEVQVTPDDRDVLIVGMADGTIRRTPLAPGAARDLREAAEKQREGDMSSLAQ